MQLRQDREVLTGEINKAMTQVNARVDDIEVALDGWDPDPSGEETLQKAKGVIRSTSIRRRGSCQDSGGGMRYAILPFQTRTGETHEEARHWVQRAVQRVRTWDAEETAPRAGCGWPSAKAQQRGRGHSSRAKTRGGWSWSLGTQLEVEYATETAWYAGEDLPSPTTLHRTQDRGGLTSQTSPATSCPGRSGCRLSRSKDPPLLLRWRRTVGRRGGCPWSGEARPVKRHHGFRSLCPPSHDPAGPVALRPAKGVWSQIFPPTSVCRLADSVDGAGSALRLQLPSTS